MLAPSALVKGIVQRLLPPGFIDDRDSDKPMRLGRYGEQQILSVIRKQHLLADEGSYFVTNNAQTGLATAFLGTSFSETTIGPYLHIVNTDNAGGKSICLDYLNLICTVVGAFASAGSTLMCAWTIDQSNARYTSGGTDITNSAATNGGTFSPNTGVSKRGSVSQIYAGALTLAAATAARRLIVPQRLFRVTNSTTVAGAAQDEVRMNFGGVEDAQSAILDLTTAKTVGYREIMKMPPIVIAPGHCATLHLWSPGQAVSTTGITYLPELGHWER